MNIEPLFPRPILTLSLTYVVSTQPESYEPPFNKFARISKRKLISNGPILAVSNPTIARKGTVGLCLKGPPTITRPSPVFISFNADLQQRTSTHNEISAGRSDQRGKKTWNSKRIRN